MITHLSTDQVCKAVGHSRATKTRDLVTACRKLGVKLGGKRLRPLSRKSKVTRALIKLIEPGKRKTGWHWQVWWDGHVYDPCWMPVAGIPVAYLEIIQ